MNDKKLERPLYLDMDFNEALRRYAQTDPKEVEPPAGRKRKAPKVAGVPVSRAEPPRK